MMEIIITNIYCRKNTTQITEKAMILKSLLGHLNLTFSLGGSLTFSLGLV